MDENDIPVHLVVKGSKDEALRAVDQRIGGSWYCESTTQLEGNQTVIKARFHPTPSLSRTLYAWMGEHPRIEPGFGFPVGTLLWFHQ